MKPCKTHELPTNIQTGTTSTTIIAIVFIAIAENITTTVVITAIGV